MATSTLKHKNMPHMYWGDEVNTTIYIQNKFSAKNMKMKEYEEA